MEHAANARGSVLNLKKFRLSKRTFDVTRKRSTRAQRHAQLVKRAYWIGEARSKSPAVKDPNIFRDTGFDSRRKADRRQLVRLVNRLLRNRTVSSQVDRLVRSTAIQSGKGATTRIGLPTRYDARAFSLCQARWDVIQTLCHEILHALAHPAFGRRAGRVQFSEVLIEGFTEALATQFFNRHVRPKAARDLSFKVEMEWGTGVKICPTPRKASVGYAEAGAGAETIRTLRTVGDDRFRAAFFLGQVHLLGL
jgi:hypothetical protein